MKHRILVVDDDPISLTQTRLLLEENGYLVQTASSGDEAVDQLKAAPDHFALIILDHQMRGKNGPATAKEILALNPHAYILMYSLDMSRSALKDAWRAGAIDFIDKGEDVTKVLETVKAWCCKYEETNQSIASDRLMNREEQLLASVKMAGRSKSLVEMVKRIQIYRQTDEDVLILGETGTGKELVARSLHVGEDATFFVINCAKYTEGSQLLESELFGHEKGSFTGATETKEGLLEKATGGTIFFDEMHHLSKQAQAKLLRVLGEKRGMRVGGRREYPIRCKFVFASKSDLPDRVERGEVLEDFYYRLERFVVRIPPLRERPEDVEPLVSHFIKRHYARKKGDPKKILLRTVRYLERYPWPGNVRELQNTVEQLLTDVPDQTITPNHLPAKFFRNDVKSEAAGGGNSLTYPELKKALEAQEKQHVLSVLKNSASQRHAARKLGISHSTMHSLLRRLGIEFPRQSR